MQMKLIPIYSYDADIPCPGGWEKFNDSCYFFDHTFNNLNYTEAIAACENRSSQLAIIHSEEEQDFLAGMFLR